MINEDAQARMDNIKLAKSILYHFRNFILSNLTKEENNLLISYYNPEFKSHICKNLENKLKNTGTSFDYKIELPENYPEVIISISTKLQAKAHNSLAEYKNNKIDINILPIDSQGNPHIVPESVYFLTKYDKFKNKFIHETTHWLNDLTSKGYISNNPTSSLSLKKYYNSDIEVNAYLQEIIEYISDISSNPEYKDMQIEDKVKKILTTKSFLSEYKEFFDNLTDNNKNKVLKRIYNYFQEFRNLFENNQYVCRYKDNPLPIELRL